MKVNRNDFTFEGLWGAAGETKPTEFWTTSLCYLVGLTDSPAHKISDLIPAKRILSWLYSMEEQAQSVEHLKAGEEYFGRYFAGGFQPLTPCMIVEKWSPITAMLDAGLEPVVLNREQKARATVTGIWEPTSTLASGQLETAQTDEELFWAIIGNAFSIGFSQKKWVSIVAEPGWEYRSAIGSLSDWSKEDVEKAGRILWKRTFAG